jgi:hypothetical protein
MGVVISESTISVDELAAQGRFLEAEPERARTFSAPVVQAPVIVEQFVEPVMEYITTGPAVEYVTAAPAVEYVTAAPVTEYVTAAPIQYIA